MTEIAKLRQLRHRCFFDITIGTKYVGRIVFELFNDICPKTCDNFRSLCTGERGLGKTTGKPLHYKNAIFHRVVKHFIIQSGDFSMGNGRGGESIFGGTFNDENFDERHDKPFLLSMANRGKNTNGSQFFITLNPAPHLDGVHVVFGHVLSGQEVIHEIQNQPTGEDCKPLEDVLISNCGELIPQIKAKVKKKKHRKEESKKSDGEITSEDEDRDRDEEQKSRKKKERKHKKHKKAKEELKEDEEDKPIDALSAECSVKPEEIPDIPENEFLMRKVETETRDNEENRYNRGRYRDRSSSGRKFKGRGHKRYRTPSPNHHYRSGSEDPPHWKSAQQNVMTLKEVISIQQRKHENRYSDRNRFERRASDRQRYDFNRNMSRGFDIGDRFHSQRESSDNENSANRQTYSRKRVFTEEPNPKRFNRSLSPKHISKQRDDENRNNGSSDVTNRESKQYSERKGLERPFIKSEVKVSEDLNPKRNRSDTSREKRHSEGRNDKRSEERPLDLTDIPLPKSEDNRRNSSEGHENRSERTVDSELRHTHREDRHKRIESRDRDREYGSHRKVSSRRRRHSTDSQ